MKQWIIQLTLTAFIGTSLGVPSSLHAQTILNLPAIGTMVTLSPVFKPLQIKGIKVYKNNPLQFDFLVDKGDSHLSGGELHEEITRLSKYFLTCLTVPEKDLWVNLSPYEKNRIAPENFGVTQMGKDLLEQDYLLKQFVASLTYPEHPLGKAFWKKVYKKAYELYGTTEITVDTFNKVWIVPQTGEVFVNGNNAFVVQSRLGVMMDTDYLALKFQTHQGPQKNHSEAYTQVFREMILPELRREINENKNFAVVRQIYDAMILATWYKKHLKDGFLGKSYVGQNKIKGVDVDDKTVKERIFGQYVHSFAKRVYNYVKEDYDPFTQKTIPRRYTSGGFDGTGYAKIHREGRDPSRLFLGKDLAMASISLLREKEQGQIISFPPVQDPAMILSLRKFLRILGVALLVSIAGAAAFNGSAQAATFHPQSNGDMVVDVDSNKDTLGHIFAKMPIHGEYFQELKQQKLWGEQGAISQLDVQRNGGPVIKKDLIYKGERLTIKAPQKTQTAPLIQAATADPTEIMVQPAPLQTTVEEPAAPLPSTVVEAGNAATSAASVPGRDAGTKVEAPEISPEIVKSPVTAVSSVVEKNDGINGDSNGLITIAIAGVALAIGRMLFWAKNKVNLSNLKSGSSAPPPYKPGPAPINGPVNHERPVALQAASLQEQGSLAAGLSQMQRAEQEGLYFKPSPNAGVDQPNVPPPKAASSFWGKLFSFQGLYVLGIVGTGLLGFDAFSSGGYLYATGTFVLTALLATAHEFQHMFAAGNTTGQWGKAFSSRNIKRAFKFWNPGVSLPMAKDGKINTKVRWAGFGGTLILGGGVLAVMSLVGLMVLGPLMVSAAVATAIVGTNSFISDILFKKRTQEGGDFFCGISGLMKPVSHGGVKLIQDNNDVTVAVITPEQFLKKIDMPDGQEVLNWVEQWGKKNNAWQWGKDRERAYLAVNDNLKDDLQKHFSKEKFEKIWALLKPKSLFTSIQWLLRILAEALSDRGAQQKGAGIFLQGRYILEKLRKLKRAILRPAWHKGGPVFWRSLDQEFANQFENVLPSILHPANDFGGPNVVSIYQHNRFATQGELVDSAAHPHSSKGVMERVFGFDPAGTLKKIITQVVFFFSENGDNNGMDLNGVNLGFFEMRRFFASIQHKYYAGEVNKQYLRKTVIIHSEDFEALKENKLKLDYQLLLKELTRFGYVVNGRVNPEFHGFSEEFVQRFNQLSHFEFREASYHSIESALWDMPPGDAPIGALELDFFRAQGRPVAAMKKAFYLVSGFKNVKGLMANINIQKDEQHAGAVFEQVLDVVLPLLSRPALLSTQEWQKTLKDLWVEDDLEAARKMGLQEQLLMLRMFKKMLYDRITKEMEEATEAGQVFSRWMEVWREQNPTANDRDNLRRFIEAAAKNFFTADLQAAVEEFALRSLGNGSSFGTSYATNIESRTVLYNNFQDVLIGYSEKGLVGFASDPRVLKAKDADGDRLDYVMQLKQKGEITTIDYTHSGIIFKEMFSDGASWDSFAAQMKQANWGEELSPRAMRLTVPLDIVIAQGQRVFGQDNFDGIFAVIEKALTQRANIGTVQLQKDKTWKPAAAAELKERFYPTAEFVNGKKNPYYVDGPVEYEDYTNITGQDLRDAPQILAKAKEDQADPQSFNRRTSSNLAKQANDIYERHGHVRVLFVGYGNSEGIPRHTRKVLGKLIPSKNLTLETVHSNIFDKNPEKYLTRGDDKTIVMFFSKSGATYATKLAAYVTSHMIDMNHIFCVTSRMDSVLTEVLGQSLQPDAKFTERFFITGDFYPSEAPVVSELLLMYQQIRMAYQLAIDLKTINPQRWSAGPPKDKVLEMMDIFEEWTTRQMQELAQGKWKGIGKKMGDTLIEAFKVKAQQYLYLYTQYIPGALPLLLAAWLGGGVLSWIAAGTASFLVAVFLPFLLKKINSQKIGRPQNSRLGSPTIGILSEEDVVHETTEDMMIRLFSLSLASLGPKAVYGGNPVTDFLHRKAVAFGRGDILMWFRSPHKVKGGSQFNQAGFPNTGAYGEDYLKSRAQKIEVVVPVPEMTKLDDAGDEVLDVESQEIIDDTIGAFGQMVAAKGIWVTASRMASYNGRMWNDAHTFNRAGVHSTESGEDANVNVMRLLDNPFYANDNIDPESIKASAAMTTTIGELHKKGGIDMNSGLLDLKVREDQGTREMKQVGLDMAMLMQPIDGLMPQINSITVVTQPMLQEMLLGAGLN